MAPLDAAARAELLARARIAIARAIGAEPASADAPGPDRESLIPPGLHAGAFVTLRVSHQLRGCVGYPDPELPLVEVVERCAVSAATGDPRFPSVSLPEWTGIAVEISVLGPIEPVVDVSEVEVGRHGLVVELGRRRGLLLPQVATEWNWDAAELASQTCAKAGLPRDAWQHGAKLFRFEAEVFGE